MHAGSGSGGAGGRYDYDYNHNYNHNYTSQSTSLVLNGPRRVLIIGYCTAVKSILLGLPAIKLSVLDTGTYSMVKQLVLGRFTTEKLGRSVLGFGILIFDIRYSIFDILLSIPSSGKGCHCRESPAYT